ncbi:hypothetical protein [Nonomuraea sp. NPDC050783]|uniref:hypothetical protein n=1 Tax=Nonomuraea sp. NPDC050783 TaxID=3154634 RepID=UPI003465E317
MVNEQELLAVLAVLEQVSVQARGFPLGAEAQRLATVLRGRLDEARGGVVRPPPSPAELRASLAEDREEAAEQRDSIARLRDEAAAQRDADAVARRREGRGSRAAMEASDQAVYELLKAAELRDRAAGSGDGTIAGPDGGQVDGGQVDGGQVDGGRPDGGRSDGEGPAGTQAAGEWRMRDADRERNEQDRIRLRDAWALMDKERHAARADATGAGQDRLQARRDREAGARDRAAAHADRQATRADREQDAIEREQASVAEEVAAAKSAMEEAAAGGIAMEEAAAGGIAMEEVAAGGIAAGGIVAGEVVVERDQPPAARVDDLATGWVSASARDLRERIAEATRQGELARQSAVAARHRAQYLAEQAVELRRRWLSSGDDESRAEPPADG